MGWEYVARGAGVSDGLYYFAGVLGSLTAPILRGAGVSDLFKKKRENPHTPRSQKKRRTRMDKGHKNALEIME